MKPFDTAMLRLVPETRRSVAVLGAFGVVQGLATIGQAFALAALLVAVVRGQPWAAPAVACGAAFAIRAIAAGLTEVWAARAGAAVSGAVRRRVLAELLARRGASRSEPARLVTLANQGATSLEPYVARYLPALVNAAVLPPAAIVAMLALDPITGLFPILTVPLLPLFAALIGASTGEATRRRWGTLSRLSGHFLDVMRGLPTLVTYGRARTQTQTIRDVSHQHREATVGTLRLAFVSSAALELLATISVALVAVWVGIALAQGRMELWPGLPLILLAPEAYWPIRRVGAEFHAAADGAQALQDVIHALDDIHEDTDAREGLNSKLYAVAREEAGAHDGDEAREGDQARAESGGRAAGAGRDGPVRVSGLTFGYGEGTPPVLDGFSAVLPSPGLTVVTGPSGAGKTTLLDLLAGLRAPDRGEVEAPPAHLVTQRPFLAPLTLRENLLLGTSDERGQAPSEGHLFRVIADVGLTDLVRSLPAGLDTMLGDDGFGLSAGQRARLAIARAALSPARLVLFDEPTAHLDPRTEALVDDLVVRLAKDRAVVAVTHRDSLTRHADLRLDLASVDA